MLTYILTDTHFFHTNIIKYQYRPENFEKLIIKGLSIIQQNDILIHLGDICLGKDAEVHSQIMPLLSHLHSKILVLGNHDNHSNTWYCEHGWDFVCESFSAKYFGKNILFSHRPQIPEKKYDINIHGHSHGNRHRADEYCEFWNPDYHKEFCLEHNHYQPILLKTFLEKLK